MKTFKIGLTVLTLLLVTVFAAVAQTNLSFLTSRAALRAYAVEQAFSGSFSLYSSSQIGNPPIQPYPAIPTNHTSSDILKIITNQTQTVTVLNTKDWVSLYAWVVNSDGDQMFYGFAGAYPVLGPGGYSLPSLALVLQLNGQIPVKFAKPVSWAEVMYVDPISGQTYNYQQLYAYGNKVYFPSDSAGQGFLQVNFTDGTQVNYDLRNGGNQTTGTKLTEHLSSATIENLLSYTDVNQIGDTIPSYNGIGANRTYELIVTPAGGKLFLGVQINTSEGANPLGYWYRQAGEQQWQYIKAYPNGVANIGIYALGTWYIVPDWNPAQFRDPAPYIYNGGGKG